MNKEICELNFLNIIEVFLEYFDINTICNLRRINNQIKIKTDIYIIKLFPKYIPPSFYFQNKDFSVRLEYLWLKLNNKFKGCGECFCDNQYIDCDNRLYRCNVCKSRIETCNTCDLKHICDFCSFKICKPCNEKFEYLQTCYSCEISYCYNVPKIDFECINTIEGINTLQIGFEGINTTKGINTCKDNNKMKFISCKICKGLYCKWCVNDDFQDICKYCTDNDIDY